VSVAGGPLLVTGSGAGFSGLAGFLVGP